MNFVYFIAKSSLVEAAQISNNAKTDNLDQLQQEISTKMFTECENILESFHNVSQCLADAKHFQQLEQEFRKDVPKKFYKNAYKNFYLKNSKYLNY